MLTLNDGRSELWQWDTGRTATVTEKCDEVHFSNIGFKECYNVEVIDGTVRIPDELLQSGESLICWAYIGTTESGYTKKKRTFTVKKRAKPDGYVYTPAEIKSYDELKKIVDVSCSGYYIKSIDLTNKKIYLSNVKVKPTISTTDNTDKSFETPAYEVGAGFNIINKNHYVLRANIKAISNNVVTYDGDLGFTQIYDDTGIGGHTFSVPTQPEIGIVTFACNSISCGEGNVVAGNNGANFGVGNTSGYGTLVSGAFNYSPAQHGTTGGEENVNTAYCTDVHGWRLIGKGAAQCVRGIYNIADKLSKFLFIVGNGKSDTERDNAFTVGRDNNTYHRGEAYVHTIFDENGVKSAGDKLATVTEANAVYEHLNLKAPLYKGLQISNRVHSAGGVPSSVNIEVKTEAATNIVYEHITSKNVNEPIYLSNYSIAPRVTTNNGTLYFKVLMRTNQVVKPNITLMGMYDAGGNTISGSVRGIESVTSGKGTWEQLVITVTGIPANAVDFKHIYLYFAGVGVFGSAFGSNAYFDVAGWAVFDDLDTAKAYDLTVDASSNTDNGYNVQGMIDQKASKPEWVHIADLTTTEEVSYIEFDTDLNGNKFKCQKLLAYILYPSPIPKGERFYLWCNGYNSSPQFNFPIPAINGIYRISIAIEVQNFVKIEYWFSNNQDEILHKFDPPGNSVIVPNKGSFDMGSFRIYNEAKSFPVGTKCEVWGLKR